MVPPVAKVQPVVLTSVNFAMVAPVPVPLTSRGIVPGLDVPIPTKPKSFTTIPTALLDNLATKIAANLSGEVSLAVSVVAVSTVKLVAEAIAVTVLVSPVIVILSPTTNSVVKSVPTPVTVVEAIASMDPVKTEVAAPVNLPEPVTSSLRSGAVVPMPTLRFRDKPEPSASP